MLALEKLIAAFVLPPGLFILISLVILIYLFWTQAGSKLIKLLALLLFFTLFFLSTAWGVKILLLPLENYGAAISKPVSSAYPLVVLGSGINYNNSGAELSLHSRQRLSKAFILQQQLKSKIIYSGGIALDQSQISEAEVAADFLASLGLDNKDYIAETKARTTFENAFYLKQWLTKKQVGQFYLLTSAYHMMRSAAVFRSLDLNFIPVQTGFIYNHKFGWLDYLPNQKALNANLIALHEWLGIIWYYLQGRI